MILTVFEDRSSIIEAICAGADGYLLKRTGADEILVQLRRYPADFDFLGILLQHVTVTAPPTMTLSTSDSPGHIPRNS